MIASFDADNIDVRRALAERFLAEGDGVSAEKWAGDCLHINVYDPVIHVLLGDAQVMVKKFDQAAEEYQTALILKPKRPDDVKVKLAKPSSVQASERRPSRCSMQSSKPTPIIRRERRQGGDGERQEQVKLKDQSVFPGRYCDGPARTDRTESESSIR